MALFHTTVLDNQIKALPTVDTASGSIATFDTDLTENLVEVKCQIVATQSGSGTPSPSNPRPIQTYTSLNLSHSGSDTSNPNVTNIPFGQTVANGVLDITTGKLAITHKMLTLNGTTERFTNVWGAETHGYAVYKTVSEYARGNAICDKMVYSSESRSNMPLYSFGGRAGAITTMTFILPDTITSLSDANTWLQNNNLDIVYELATPYEIQLDSINLQALLNENNIWCDTGDTEVKYLLTVGKKIS